MSVFNGLLHRLTSALDPVSPEAVAANKRVWDSLKPELQTLNQYLGVQSAGCGATVGLMERCDFYCTACYLPASSNQTPPLPFEQVKQQIDEIADHLGPTGNIQLTAGEVTLLPREDLGRVVEYCLERKLKPMVMTNGQTMLRDPSYLEYLMERGLGKVAIHIDTTQRGRDGMNTSDSEVDLHWIRDAFANMIRDVRKRTGLPLHAAHTFTVTRENQPSLPEVVRWSVENSDAFRMLSLQPTAETGRTRVDRQGGDVESIWDLVCQGAGRKLSRDGMHFGHPSCNTVSMNFVVKYRGTTRVVEFLETEKDQRFMQRLLRKGFGSFSPLDEKPLDALAKSLVLLARNPNWLWDLPSYLLYRVHTEKAWLGEFLRAVTTLGKFEINPYALVVHNFMSADQLETTEGQERLDACAFRIPFQGRMVSMCEFNGSEMREANNEDIISDHGAPTSSTPQKPEGVLV
jgi:hypothetical protein